MDLVLKSTPLPRRSDDPFNERICALPPTPPCGEMVMIEPNEAQCTTIYLVRLDGFAYNLPAICCRPNADIIIDPFGRCCIRILSQRTSSSDKSMCANKQTVIIALYVRKLDRSDWLRFYRLDLRNASRHVTLMFERLTTVTITHVNPCLYSCEIALIDSTLLVLEAYGDVLILDIESGAELARFRFSTTLDRNLIRNGAEKVVAIALQHLFLFLVSGTMWSYEMDTRKFMPRVSGPIRISQLWSNGTVCWSPPFNWTTQSISGVVNAAIADLLFVATLHESNEAAAGSDTARIGRSKWSDVHCMNQSMGAYFGGLVDNGQTFILGPNFVEQPLSTMIETNIHITTKSSISNDMLSTIDTKSNDPLIFEEYNVFYGRCVTLLQLINERYVQVSKEATTLSKAGGSASATTSTIRRNPNRRLPLVPMNAASTIILSEGNPLIAKPKLDFENHVPVWNVRTECWDVSLPFLSEWSLYSVYIAPIHSFITDHFLFNNNNADRLQSVLASAIVTLILQYAII